MNVTKALETIFEACKKSVGSDKADTAFAAIVSGLSYELKLKGLPGTAENFEKAIIEEGELFKKCLEKDAA